MSRRRKPVGKQHARSPEALKLQIEAIGAHGDGGGLIEGRQVFVPLTAPGDVAIVEARGERGVLLELIEESPHRAAPPCRHFGACGGCALQHVTPAFYRTWKRQRVVEALARVGFSGSLVAELVETPVASRRRATFAVRRSGAGVILGFNARQSSAIVAIEECHILHPALFALAPGLHALAKEIDAPAFDLAVTLCRNGLDIDIAAKKLAEPRGAALQRLMRAMTAARAVRLSLNGAPVAMHEPPVVDFDGIAVTPSPGAFLQASKEGEAALIALVKAGVGDARKVADLFSGCGSFALPLARSASILAVDADKRALEALARSGADAQRAGIGVNPVRTETRNLFERPLLAAELEDFDAVVFDPPRAGARAQAEEIAKSRVRVVVGVSCDPATFARDAAILSRGGYALVAATPVDQFVYSPHIELVGLFKRS